MKLRINYRIVLPDLDKPVEQVVREIHDEAAERAADAVRAMAPVRTGAFVGRLKTIQTETGAGVRSEVDYAVYVRRRKGVWREAQRARKVFSDGLTEILSERADDIANAIAAEALQPLEGANG